MTEMICITCPTGCKMQAEMLLSGEVFVEGNRCKRGIDFAKAELTHPMRTLCSTVQTAFAESPMLPVRTDREIPKGKMLDVMQLLKGVVVDKAVACGEAVCSLAPVCEGNMIATSDLLVDRR